MDGRTIAFDDGQRIQSVPGLEDRVALQLQELVGRATDGVFVYHQHYGFRAMSGSCEFLVRNVEHAPPDR